MEDETVIEGFTPANVLAEALIKDRFWVYVLYWRLEIAYIGMSADLLNRLRQHIRKRDKEPGYRWDRVEVKSFPTLAAARAEERRLINLHHPEHNEMAMSLPGLPALCETLGLEPPKAEPGPSVGLARRI